MADVFAASMWWKDCDPLFTVIGTDDKKVRATIDRLMKDEVRFASEDGEDEAAGINNADLMYWSGVHLYDVRDFELDDEHEAELLENGVTTI